MIQDVIPFVSHIRRYGTQAQRSVASFVAFIERKLGAQMYFQASDVPYAPDLTEPMRIADLLKNRGVIKRLNRYYPLPDEPQIYYWRAVCGGKHAQAAGASDLHSEKQALLATVAEALERYLWSETDDYFERPMRATERQMKSVAHVPLARFVSFSEEQRERDPAMTLRPNASYLWIRGTSLVSGTPVHLPAQTVSGKHLPPEPVIRTVVTNGLATWPTRSGAQLHGMLELIERDAFMIMWFNRLTLPRIDLTELCAENIELRQVIDCCRRYRLKVHAIKMITDAPAHAVCVVLEDESGLNPRFGVGLKADGSLARAIEGGVYEALRGRIAARHYFDGGNTWDGSVPIAKVGHRDRLYYWGIPENAQKMEFLIQGPVTAPGPADWDNDTAESHRERILGWCRTMGYECITVPLGRSRMNPTDWQVEMVVIPELQPVHLHESKRHLGGTRRTSVPLLFGYTVRDEPFNEPHPFS